MRILFIVTFLANIVFAFGALPWLPNPTAIHFDLAGTPDGFTSPIKYAIVISITTGIIAMGYLGASAMSAMCAIHMPKHINIPNRDYWLNEENRPKTIRCFRSLMDSMGFLTMLWILFLQWETFRVNQAAPPQKFTFDIVMYGTIVYLVILAIIFVRFRTSFRLPKETKR